MSPQHPTEKKFEDHIEHHLIQSGYDSIDPTLYDKSLCLISTKLLDFIKSTQEKTYQNKPKSLNTLMNKPKRLTPLLKKKPNELNS